MKRAGVVVPAPAILLVIGVLMTRSLLDRRKRRENPEGIVLGNFGFAR
ncbi:MAG: hypothetical protein ACJAT6_001747 [Akkermansiaceae bacterium]|jgi:hypothetical protein